MFETTMRHIRDVGLVALLLTQSEGLIVATPECTFVPGGIEFDHPDANCSFIERDGERWLFKHWEGIPTPVDSDTKCYFATLDDAAKAAINYHTGKAEIIGGWLMPTHQHPEWQDNKLRAVLEQAHYILWQDFVAVWRNFDTNLGNLIYAANTETMTVTLEMILSTILMYIPHSRRADLSLWLRRDMGEAFVVSGDIDWDILR